MRFMIAGLGSIGKRHVRNLRALGEHDLVLLRSKPTQKSEIEFADLKTFINIDDGLNTKPDAVLVCNPTALHMQVAIPAAKAECHILLEKPLASLLAEALPLRTAVNNTGVHVLSAFQFRYHPGLIKIKELLDAGVLGRVLRADCCWGEYLPGWHPWEDYRSGYSARADLGGGVVRSLCHPLDYLRWLMGEADSIQAAIAKRSDLEIDVEDDADIFIHFQNGSIANLHLDYYRQPPKHSLEICGTEGVITWNNDDGAARLYTASDKSWQVFHVSAEFDRNTMFLDEMRHFIEVVRGKAVPICSLNDGLKAQMLIDAVYESAKKNQPVSIGDLPS